MLQRLGILCAVLVALSAATAEAGHHRRGCCASGCGQVASCYSGCGVAPCGDACASAPVAPVAPQMVEKTIYVPTYVTETRKVRCVEYQSQVRERKYTVQTQVPERKSITENYTVLVPQTRMREESYVVCKPVWREVTQNFTVMVPYQEKRSGTRTIYKCVAETVMRNVCEDQGHWEQRVVPAPVYADDCGGYDGSCYSGCGRRHHCRRGCYSCGSACGNCGSCCGAPAGCGDCAPAACSYKVWVPNIVTRQVPVTVNKVVPVSEPYEYLVTLCRAEPRTRTVKVVEYLNETKTRQVPYTVCVPEQKSRTYDVTVYKCVPVEKTEKFTVAVPVTVEREVQVQVCKMVPKVIQVPVYPACPPMSGCTGAAGCCGSACGACCR